MVTERLLETDERDESAISSRKRRREGRSLPGVGVQCPGGKYSLDVGESELKMEHTVSLTERDIISP